MRFHFIRWIAAAAVLFSGLLLPGGEIGVNLEGLADWSAGFCFADAMKTSRAWGLPDRPWVHEVKTDAAGWPLEDAGVCVICDRPGRIGGRYQLEFRGQADIQSVAFPFQVENIRREGDKTTAELVVGDDAPSLMIAFVNTDGGVRDVRLYRPGATLNPDGSTATFMPEFLAALRPFAVLRYMDFLATNEQNASTEEPWFTADPPSWDMRRLPSDASQAGKLHGSCGAAYEYVAELARASGKGSWINVPIHADDDYIRKMAAFFRDRLPPGAPIYVELSNEVWNWGFAAAQYNAKKGEAAGLSYPINYAKRVMEMAAIWREVFGADDRLRIVLAWQFGYDPPDWQIREMFRYIEAQTGKPVHATVDVLAVAPYFSEPKPEDCTSIPVILDHFRSSSDGMRDRRELLAKLAAEYGLREKLAAYEGGPHHQGQVETNLATRIAAHHAPEMEAIVYDDLVRNWRAVGGGLFCYFTLSGGDSRYGCWGACEDFRQLDTPKYRALARATAAGMENQTTSRPE